MNTILRTIALLALASPAFGQYPAVYGPYGYPAVAPTPVIMMPAPVPQYVDPSGYRPTHLHGMLNPFYAQQFALDVNYANYYERKRQFMDQAERQRQMILAMAPERRAQKAERRAASQQRALNKQHGNAPQGTGPAPDINDLVNDLRKF